MHIVSMHLDMERRAIKKQVESMPRLILVQQGRWEQGGVRRR
jgi:hypothetical protein